MAELILIYFLSVPELILYFHEVDGLRICFMFSPSSYVKPAFCFAVWFIGI